MKQGSGSNLSASNEEVLHSRSISEKSPDREHALRHTRERESTAELVLQSLYESADDENWDFSDIPDDMLYNFVEVELTAAGGNDVKWSTVVPRFLMFPQRRILRKRQRNPKSNGDKNVDAKVQPPKLPDAPSSKKVEKVDEVTISESQIDDKIGLSHEKLKSEMHGVVSEMHILSASVKTELAAQRIEMHAQDKRNVINSIAVVASVVTIMGSIIFFGGAQFSAGFSASSGMAGGMADNRVSIEELEARQQDTKADIKQILGILQDESPKK